MSTTPEQPRLLEVGDVIYGERGSYGFERLTISRVTEKRAYVDGERGYVKNTFKREAYPDRSLYEIGNTDTFSHTHYSLSTPELDARWLERQLRYKLTTALEKVGRRQSKLTPDQCTALLEALAPFLPAQ